MKMLVIELLKYTFKKKGKSPIYQIRKGSNRFKSSILNIKTTSELNENFEKEIDVEAKNFKLSLKKQNKVLEISSKKTIIENADEAGIELRYSCATGGCGSCKVKMISGNVKMNYPNCLSVEERNQGYILACVSYISENTVLDA